MFQHRRGLDLADLGIDGEIDQFIGSDIYWNLLCRKVRLGIGGEPVSLESR